MNAATRRRLVTAALLLAVFIPAMLWAPMGLWTVLVAGVVALAAFEWARLSGFATMPARLYALAAALLSALPPLLWPAFWTAIQPGLYGISLVFWLLVAPLWLAGRFGFAHPGLRAVVGWALLVPTAAALGLLHTQGPTILIAVLAVVWIADSAAYFAGRRFGRTKLAPAISPGKTWEGVAGAVFGLALYSLVLNHWGGWPLIPVFAVLAGLLYLSVLGDLFESWIKRVAGVKDSGSMLPGHGGVLDRVDGLVATLPAAAAMLMWAQVSG